MKPLPSDPLVTVVTPSLNHGRYIRDTIESVLAQDYPRIEYVVVDGGSTDDTLRILGEYDGRIRWVSEPDRGQTAAINKGFAMTRGEILAWVNSDDMLLPGAIATAVGAFTRDRRLGLVYGDCHELDAEGRHVTTARSQPPDVWVLVHGYDYVHQASAFFRRDAFDAVGPLDETLNWAMDYDLFIRLSLRYRTAYHPSPLAQFRYYDTCKTASGGWRRCAEILRLVRRYSTRSIPPAYPFYIWEAIGATFGRPGHQGRSVSTRLGLDERLASRHRRVQSLLGHRSSRWHGDGWVAPSLDLFLANEGGSALAIRGSLPPSVPLPGPQRLRISVNGRVTAERTLAPGKFDIRVPLRVDDKRQPLHVHLDASRSFVPARSLDRSTSDNRRLAYVLDGVEWIDEPEVDSPPSTTATGGESPSDRPVSRERPRVSVIIPLEFHRGQSDRCVRSWLLDQTYPRSRYELVIVAPDDFPKRELKGLRRLLSERDRLILHPGRHDMTLCAAGAEAADGDVLFFTESHCWPEPDVLEKATAALCAHPEWAGLSARSVPVTHNRLSIAEAKMYQTDIEYGMLQHPWRKILDQCFFVWRDAYVATGGFEPELGHFAEWVLAARFYQRGLSVGYAPEVRVHHFYSGDLREWKVFTRDFTDGEMRFHARRPDDPCKDLFDTPPELGSTWARRRELASALLNVRWQDWRRADQAAYPSDDGVGLREVLRWLPDATAGMAPARWRANWRTWVARARVESARRLGRTAALETALLDYCAALVHERRLEAIRRWNPAPDDARQGAGAWTPGGGWPLPILGFHPIEESGLGRFRWSEPAATIGLPLQTGPIILSIDLLPFRPPGRPAAPRFYFNEREVPPDSIGWSDAAITLRLPAVVAGAARLSWSCRPLHAAGDPRSLGLPVRRVSWRRTEPRPPIAPAI